MKSTIPISCLVLFFGACQSADRVPPFNESDSLINSEIVNPIEVPKSARRIRPFNINSAVKHLLVKKSENKLYAYFGDTFKVYRVALGGNPVGHKVQKGDNRTPEGDYTIVLKNPNSRGYKSLKISYPNNEDRSRAWQAGLDPGGDICIHGLWWDQQDPITHWQSNWTQGCVALNNQQMDELYKHTAVGTTIKIIP